MANQKSLFHKLKTIIGYSIATVVIIVALGISGLRFMLTTANLYQNEVELFASSLLEQPLKIGRMDAKLSGLIPTIIFYDVELLSPKNKKTLFSLKRIDVGLSFDDLLWQQKVTPSQLTVRGMNLHVTRTVDGSFKIKGMDLDAIKKPDDDNFSFLEKWLVHQGEIALEESTFTWKDEQSAGLTWVFNDINLLIKKTNERHQLSFLGELPNSLGNKVEIELDFIGDIRKPDSWDISAFVKSDNLNLKSLQRYIENINFKFVDGEADIALWFEWKNKVVSRLSGEVDFTNFSYLRENIEKVSLKRVSAVFDALRNEDDIWNVSVEKFNYENRNKIFTDAALSLSLKYSNKNMDTFYVKTDALKLSALSNIIMDNHLVSKESEGVIKNINLYGDIRNFSIALQNNELSELHANFKNFSINPWKNIPRLDALSGNVGYENNQGELSLLSENSTIGFPVLFRKDFKIKKLSSKVLFSNTEKGLLFDIRYLEAENNDVSTQSSAKLWFPKNGASPHFDMQTYISEGDASNLYNYLPVGIMSKQLVTWLDEGILAGKTKNGVIVFNGRIKDFPFNNQEGFFAVDVDATDVVINYQNGWPKVTKANVTTRFTGQGMKLELSSGDIEGNHISRASVDIPSFLDAKLKVNISTKGEAYNALQYLVMSPILSEAKSTINSMRWLGQIDTDINLSIPLEDDVQKISYSGSARLRDASLFMLQDKIDITSASGELFFTEKSFSSKNLVANILGKKAKLIVTSKNKDIHISANSKFEPSEILRRFNIPGANKISGIADFKSVMTFPAQSDRRIRYPSFKLTSNLLGVKSNLPDGFYKKQNKRKKITFETLFTGNKKIQLGLELGGNFSSILELDQSKEFPFLSRGAISASIKKAVLPKKNVLYIDGIINSITPEKWFKALDLGAGGKPQKFFINPIVINLNKLKILTNKKSNTKKSRRVSVPQYLPTFEGIIKQLYYNKTYLGRVDFRTSKKKYGMRFDEIIVSTKNMKLLSHGDWRYSRGKHKTNMDITLSSKNFGGMLSDFGFKGIIGNGVAKTISKIHWKGAPTQFSYAHLNGDIQLNLENGSIIEVDAGAGRLLGLFSLSALPRKLVGDFKDTFKEGFNFDTAEGEINIENGDAYTDNFEINSPVAEITISGRTGLVDKDYENTVEVIPKVGGGVAGITALLVNLPTGIGMWLLDKLTGEQFNKASAKTYEISGSWKKPIVEDVTEDE